VGDATVTSVLIWAMRVAAGIGLVALASVMLTTNGSEEVVLDLIEVSLTMLCAFLALGVMSVAYKMKHD